MKQSRFCEEKIIAILAEQERGMGTAEVCQARSQQWQHLYLWTATPR